MIGYVILVTNGLARATKLYDTTLKSLNFKLEQS